MMYGKPNNPYQTNALNRRSSNAPINGLMKPMRFQSGGSAEARRLMSQDYIGQIKEAIEQETSTLKQVIGEKKDYKAAQADFQALQKKARKKMPWWMKAIISFIPGIGAPLSALINSLEQRKNIRNAEKLAKKGAEHYKGLRGVDTAFESAEDELGGMVNKAPLQSLFTNLLFQKIGSDLTDKFSKMGTEDVAKEALSTDVEGNILDASGDAIGRSLESGDEWIYPVNAPMENLSKNIAETPMDLILSQAADWFPKLPGIIKENPEIAKVLFSQGGETIQDLMSPKAPLADFTSSRPWGRYNRR